MAMNPFIGWTQADLETELRNAQEDLAAGSSVASTGAGDTNVSNQSQLQIMQRIEMLYAALNALDSDTYPIASISRVDRTLYASP